MARANGLKSAPKLAIQRFVRSYAVRASLLAASMTVVLPGPAGILMASIGLDPVQALQRRMFEELKRLYGVRIEHGRYSLLEVRHRKSHSTAKKIGREMTEMLVRRGGLRFLGGYAGKVVPVVGAVLAGALAYRETYAFGIACIEGHRN